MINLNDPEQKKEIRIFVSSTFRDMQGERDHLVKNVFPKLRKISQSRGVELTEVDLRWGVTEAQAEDGKVIEICLREIDRCRPFFIGLLGGRYGWVPESREYERHRHILENFPWVKQDIDDRLSITEMEIQYGVLRNPAMELRAFFYLRDPATISSGNCEKLGSVAADKLSSLKSLLTTQDDYPHHQYADLKELEQWITDDFKQFIDTEYPEGDTPSPLVRAQQDHAAFARSRLKLYIGGENYFERIDEHVNSTSPPLVIVGESGSGKSALLANWISHHQRKYPNEFVFYHFIGGAPDSSDHIDLMRRIMEDMRERFGLTDEVPTNPDRVAEALPLFLAKTPQAERWVLVLDALNQLEEKGNARWLGWLPTFIPQNIRVVISTLPGESLDALEKRDYPQLVVQPMNVETRKRLIRSYLTLYTKELSEDLADRIANGPSCDSPLILRTLLDEIRIFGVHEKLQERIDYYLQPGTPSEFFDAVLRRLEEDYEQECPGMVGEVLSLIWAARRGFAERELLEITGIPPLFWTPLYRAIENHLVSRSGLLDFFHDYLRQAVEARYLVTTEKQNKVHKRLAKYFNQDHLSDRVVDERPYHLHKSEQWDELKNCIGLLDLFSRLIDKGRSHELLLYWHDMASRYDMESVYIESLGQYESGLKTKTSNDPEWKSFSAMLLNVARFFEQEGARYAAAEPLYRRALAISERLLGADHHRTIEIANDLGRLFQEQGKHGAAIPLLRRALKFYQLEQNETKVALSLSSQSSIVNNLGLSFLAAGYPSAAEKLFRQALEFCEPVLGAEHPNTATINNNLALSLTAQNQYAEAESLFRHSLEIHERMLGSEHPMTIKTLNNLGISHLNQGDYAAAESLLQRALEISERLLGCEHPETVTCMTSVAHLFYEQGNYTAAEALYRRALEIREQVLGTGHPDTASSLDSLAELFHVQEDYAAAEPLYRRALEIREQVLGTGHPDTASSANHLARLFHDRKDYAAAEPLYRRALEIREQILGNDHPDTASSVNNLAKLFYDREDYAAAEPLFRRALEIREQVLGNEHPDTASSANSLARLFHDRDDYAAAEPLYRRALEIREQVLGPEHPGTATSLNNLATLFHDGGNCTDAEPLYLRALEIREQVLGPEHPDTATSLNNLAILHHDRRDYAAAERLYRRALEIREQVLGFEHPDTATSLNDLASLLRDSGDYAAAEPMYRRALEIREQVLGSEHQDTATSMHNLAKLLLELENYTAAEPLFRRALEVREQVLGSEHMDTATTISNLAGLLHEQGNYDAAEPLYRRALNIIERVLGLEHTTTAVCADNLAILLHDRGEYAAAEQLYRRALRIREKELGPDHPDSVTSVNRLASLLYDREDYAAAEPLYRRALEIHEKVLGPEHPDTAISVNNLAELFSDQGNYTAAEPLYRRALEIWERVSEEVNPDSDATRHALAMLFLEQENFEMAEVHFLKSLSARKKLYGSTSAEVASTLTNLSVLYRKQGRLAEAEDANILGLEIYKSTLGSDHPRTSNAGINLAVLKFDQEKFTEAIKLCNRYLDMHKAHHEKGGEIAPNQLRKMEYCFYQLALRQDVPNQDWKAAKSHLQKAINYLEKLDDRERLTLVKSYMQEIQEVSEQKD